MNNAIDENVKAFHKGFYTTEQGKYEDPTYLGWKFVFDFNPVHRNFETGETDDPLFSENSSLESAIHYLRATGYNNRAEMLKKFKNTLQHINESTPWYFQTLNGVNELWKIEYGESFNPFRGKDKVLEVSCLESIDLRMTALADMYRKATFDAKFMRHILPENLRWFTVKIQVAEIRKFHELKEKASLNINNGASTSVTGVLENLTRSPQIKDDLISLIEFQCAHCIFDFAESFPSDKELAMNGTVNMAAQKFKIKVGRVVEYNRYKIMDVIMKEGVIQENGPFAEPIPSFDNAFNKTSDNILSNTIQGFTNNLQDKINELTNIPGNLISKGVNNLSSELTSAQLGNVYDLRNQTLVTAINSFLGKNDQIGIQKLGKDDVYPGVPGIDSETKISTELGNVYK